MAEIVPVVYDIAQPTPIPLEDLSAIAVSVEIWRNEIHKRRASNTIQTFYPHALVISSKSALLPDLPSVIYDIIDAYLPIFGSSATIWMCCQYKRIFHLHRANPHSVLEVFDDFVADYSGTIDFVRTAKRMMVCDRLNEIEKFAIACTYFFEDDIARIWPSVCESFDLNTLDFAFCSQLYYWICRLKNQLDKILIHGGLSVDEVMFDLSMIQSRQSAEYFWNRMSIENRMEKGKNFWKYDERLFISFALSKLNDQALDEFANTNGVTLIRQLLIDHLRYNWFLPPTWKIIKNKMNGNTFRTLVVEMLKLEQATEFERYRREPKNWLYHCSLIWNSIPTDVKRSIVEGILSNTRLFETMRSVRCSRRFVGFLLIILSSASFEQRSAFWRNCWPHLIDGTRSEDLLRIMKVCFENEEEIVQFKDRILAGSENVRIWCSTLLSNGMFDEFTDLLSFFWPEGQAAKRYKLQLLQSTFLGENSDITLQLVRKVNEFIVFIDDAFDNKDQSSEFKNQLMSSPAARDISSSYPWSLLGCAEEIERFKRINLL